jgi:hypothetical protein
MLARRGHHAAGVGLNGKHYVVGGRARAATALVTALCVAIALVASRPR